MPLSDGLADGVGERRPDAADVGLGDEELQTGTEADPRGRPCGPRSSQVTQFVQRDQYPPDRGVHGDHQPGLPRDAPGRAPGRHPPMAGQPRGKPG